MKVLIIEDEITAAEHLTYLLKKVDAEIEVLTILDSVKSSITYFKKPIIAQVIFMDIHLSDGLSFEIFEHVNLQVPIIFTTAYDQYAIQAFKVNSIDYLLKPINEDELLIAINKFKSIKEINKPIGIQIESVLELLQTKNKTYKTTYLVQKRDALFPLKTEEIAYFYIETGVVKAVALDNKSFIINEKLEDIEVEVNPSVFYRVNRQMVLNKNAIVNMKHYFNGKLVVNIIPKFEDKIVISKAKTKSFKEWIDS